MNVTGVALLSALSMAAIACGGGGDTGNSGGSTSHPSGGGNAGPNGGGGEGGATNAGGSDNAGGSASTGGGTPQTGLHVEGNTLVDGGKTVLFHGVNRSGGEFACIQGNGIFDGPNDEASVVAMASWKINAVRVPLNEDCWLAINGAAAQYSGATYQSAIGDYVQLLRSHGLYVILDLHWNGPGTMKATGQLPMADADHANDFWKSVAGAFKQDHGVVFDLYNEPYLDDGSTSTHDAWACWLNGCTVDSYKSAGMQSLVDSVRGAGATNVIMLGGIAYSNDLSGWLAHEPHDPAGNLAASFHGYNFNICTDASCWNGVLEPVAAKVPLISGEIGENDCGHGYIDGYMQWADTAKVSYLGWTWNTWDCDSGPALISDYDGTATGFGAGYKAHLAGL